MPNWTTNIVTIEGSTQELQNLYNRIINADGDFDFNSLIPLASELENTESPGFEYARKLESDEEILETYSHRYKTLQDVADARRESDRLIELYGFDNWYDWCVKNWGTKWNASDTTCVLEEENLVLNFATAWSEPIPIYNKLVEEYPNFFYQIETQWEGEEEGRIVSYYPTTKMWSLNKTKLVHLHPETDEHLFFTYVAVPETDEEYYLDQHGNKWDYDDYHDLDTEYIVVQEDLAESN